MLFWTSRQVLREYLASTTRPGTVVPPPRLEVLSEAVRRFEAEFEIADEDAAVTRLLLDLLKSRSVQGNKSTMPISWLRCSATGFHGC